MTLGVIIHGEITPGTPKKHTSDPKTLIWGRPKNMSAAKTSILPLFRT